VHRPQNRGHAAATVADMPSRRRSFLPGEPVHLTANGVEGEPIFRTDFDRFALLALLRKVTGRFGWQIAAWCLMDTHYHLVVSPGSDLRVARAMQTLNSVYAREFNHRYERRGHLFRERYTYTEIASSAHLRSACEYVWDNPVRAGIVRHALEYPWSGTDRLEPRLHENGTNLVHIRHRAVRSRG
jgi:putative transposase